MKKLGKLQINSDRIINDEELRKLKGGDIFCCKCTQGFDCIGDAIVVGGCENVQDALTYAWLTHCSMFGYGVTCSGENCPC